MYPWEKMTLAEQYPHDLDDIPKVALTRRAPNMSDENRKKAIASYYACVSEVDDNVGKLMAEMDKLKLWDNTIVVFTSDHGWHLGEHDSLWGKVTLFEEAARVPLIMIAPGMSQSATSPRTVRDGRFLSDAMRTGGPADAEREDGWDEHRAAASRSAIVRKGEASLQRRPSRQHLGQGVVHTEQFRYTEWGDNAAKGRRALLDHAVDPKEYILPRNRSGPCGDGDGN